MGTYGENEPAIVAAIAQGFQCYRTRQWAEPPSPKFLRYRQTLQLHLAALAPGITWKGTCLISLADTCVQFPLRELNDLAAERALIRGELKVHHASSLSL